MNLSRFTKFTLLISFVLVLGGCRSIWDPTFMPAGYQHHQNIYKSAPGPEMTGPGEPYTGPYSASSYETDVYADESYCTDETCGADDDYKVDLEMPEGYEPREPIEEPSEPILLEPPPGY